MARKITVTLNSPFTFVDENETIKTWGDLKNYLVREKGYSKNIAGYDFNTGVEYDKPDQKLPEGDLDISLVAINEKDG